MAGLSEDEELELELETAKAKTRQMQTQSQELDAEIAAKQPVPVEPELPVSQGYVEGMLPEETPTAIKAGVVAAENIVNPYPLAKGLGKGAVNAGIGVLESAHAVGSAIGSGLGGVYDEYAPSVGLSPRDPEGVKRKNEEVGRTQKMFEGMKIKPETRQEEIYIPAGEVAAGFMVGDKGAGAVRAALPRGLKTIGGFVPGSVGAAVAAPEQKGLIFGDEGGIGLDADPNDDPGTAKTKHLINLAMDNLTISAGMAAGSVAGGRIKDFVKNLTTSFKDWRNLPAIEKEYIGDMIEIGAKIPENATKKERDVLLRKLDETYEAYHKQTYDLGEGIGEKTLQRDPVSILTKGLDPKVPNERARQIHLESLRASAKSGSTPQTIGILEQPKNMLDESLKDIQSTRGGNDAIEQTKRNLQEQAHVKTIDTDFPPEMAKEQLTSEKSGMHDALRKDETFGDVIKNSDDASVSLNVNKKSLDKQTEILYDTKGAEEANRKLRNQAHDNIPKKTPANMETFNAAHERTKEHLPKYINDLIEKGDGTYNYLHNEVRPRLSEYIGQLKRNPNPNVDMGAVIDLQNNIRKDQISDLVNNGNTVTRKRAEQAVQADTSYGQLHNQGIGDELKQNSRMNDPKMKPIPFKEEGRSIILRAIKDPNRRESVDQLRRIVGPENEGKIADVALAESMKDITAGKGLSIDKVTSDLQQMSEAFTGPQKKRIEGFLTDIRNRGLSIEDLQKKIPELEKIAESQKEKIYMDQFEGLFKKKFGTYEGVDNGYRAFQKMLEDKDGDSIKKLLQASTPEDKAGIQAAWAKAAEEKLGLNSKEIVPFSEEFEKHGKDVFGDNPAVDAILELKKEAQRIQHAQTKPGVQAFDANENQNRLTSAVSLVSTWMFGVLNPKAARIKTVTSSLSKTYTSNPKARQAIDNVLSDNKLLKSHIKRMIDENQKKLSPAEAKMLRDLGILVGISSLRDQTEEATSK